MMIAQATMQNLYVVETNLNIRSGPGIEFSKVGLMPQYELVDVRYTENGFGYIGEGHWVCMDYLEKYTDGLKPWKAKTTANLNKRKGPGTNYVSTGILKKGARVTIIGEENGWFKVKFKGKVFWLSGMYLTV